MIILGTNSIKDTGFSVDNSARFDGSSYLHRTPSATGNPKKWTYSVWVKMAQENPGYFLSAGSGTQSKFIFGAYGGGDIDILTYEGYVILANTARKFRDPSAWYNIILAVDTTQSSYVNGLKLWVNGELQSLTLSSVGSENGYTQNTSLRVGTNNEPIHIGRDINDSGHWKGYMAECALVNDAQLDADQFGEFDEDSGIWKPIDISGLTFGTNGFYLDFKDSSAFGNDVSGNNNDFTVVGLAAIDQSTDTCTNNFSTMNPLRQPTANPATFSNGNLTVQTNTSNGYYGGRSTIGVSSGRWYFEAKLVSYSALTGMIGIQNVESYTPELFGSGQGAFAGFSSTGLSYTSSGTKVVNNSSTSYGDTYAAGDIISVALNLEDNEVKFYKNGTVQNSGTAISITAGLTYVFAVDDESSGRYCVWDCNFGSPPFAISSGNTDGNGYGNFEYAVPSGYYALNTKNLAEYG